MEFLKDGREHTESEEKNNDSKLNQIQAEPGEGAWEREGREAGQGWGWRAKKASAPTEAGVPTSLPGIASSLLLCLPGALTKGAWGFHSI